MEGSVARRIVVPVNGAVTDEETVLLACRLARRDHARVFALTVLEVRRGLPLSTRMEEEIEACGAVLDHAEQVGQRIEVSVEPELLQAREAGPAIVDQAREWQADLLLVGLPFRRRFGEFHMGRTVPYLLKYTACRTLVLREPAQ